jgi:2-hydroxycyclohexanecarboxyl-CoA dehydrogenase
MNLNLQGHSAAVIGCARGIGRAIAEGFAAEGCNVRGFDREKTADFITAGDVTNYEAMKSFASGFAAVDHVVFCVGIGSGKFGFPFWNLEPSDWARVLEVNLIGAVNVAHAFAPKLIQRGAGSMLFLVSVAGQIGSQTDPPYSASKAALINFTQCAAKDLGPHNIRVNALAPINPQN